MAKRQDHLHFGLFVEGAVVAPQAVVDHQPGNLAVGEAVTARPKVRGTVEAWIVGRRNKGFTSELKAVWSASAENIRGCTIRDNRRGSRQAAQ